MTANVYFIHIPKTAGQTIQEGLRKSHDDVSTNLGHTLAKLLPSDLFLQKNAIILTVIRNPYDRLFSIFEFYQKKERHPNFHIPDWLTFEDFVLCFEKSFYRKKTPYFTCCEYMTDKSGNFLVTDYLHFEKLEEDYRTFCKKYSFREVSLKKINMNPFKNENINKESLYTPVMREVVERIFRQDLDTFGYSYESYLQNNK